MRSRFVEPDVQAILDEANFLPECAAKNALLERAASYAETLGDLDTAWSARCQILSSSSSHESPKFETLFVCLAWCLAVSDREPQRFRADSVLWQYKWVATAAPEYASVPRSVLGRIVDDMDERFQRAGWGRRAALQKRLEQSLLTGDLHAARELVAPWRAAPRDRGADCLACETSTLVAMFAELGDDDAALKEARPVISGRLSCATVPHSTFGDLLLPLTRMRKHADARSLYDRGRRLVAGMEEGGCTLSSPYLLHAAFLGEAEQVTDILRARLPQAASLRSDLDRAEWFRNAAGAMEFLIRRGVAAIESPRVPGVCEGGECEVGALRDGFGAIASVHASALDARNGNRYYTKLQETLVAMYGGG